MAKIFNSIFGIENLESLVEYAFLSMILGLAIFVQLRLVTDGRTDRQTHDDS